MSDLSRRTFLRWSAAGAAAVGGSAFLVACGSDPAPAATPSGSGSAAPSGSTPANTGPLAVQLSWIKNIEFAGEYFALEKGYYKAAGITNEIQLVAGGAAATGVEQGLSSKKVWIGMSAPQLTAPAILEGAAFKTVAATFQKNPFAIVSSAAKPIKTPQDMKGRKIGVQDSNTLVFDALLAANGLDRKDITIVPAQFDPSPLANGEVDGWVSYVTNEPITLAAKGFKNEHFLFADFGLPLVAETLVVRQETIDGERDLLKKFLKAEIQGWTDAVADPAQSAKYAVEIYGKDQGLDLKEQTAEATAQNDLIVSDDTKKNGILTITDALIAQNIEALGKAGIDIKAEELFDMSVLAEVYAENPELKKG